MLLRQVVRRLSARRGWLSLAVVAAAACGGAAAPSPVAESSWVSRERAGITVQAQGPDITRLDEWLTVAETARARIQSFFDRTLEGSFTLTVYPTRDAVNAYWRAAFRVREDQLFCWMIATAGSTGVIMLSPRVWASEQCGHSGTADQVSTVLTHEIVHVLHARTTTNAPFDSSLSFMWFREGVASFAANQYSITGLGQSAASVTSLASVQTVANNYAIATSMVAFIDARFGRARTASLLRYASTTEVLNDLGLTENQFLEQWREWCCR